MAHLEAAEVLGYPERELHAALRRRVGEARGRGKCQVALVPREAAWAGSADRRPGGAGTVR